MSKQPLLFRYLSIRRMPGLPRGIADYSDLSPHLNLIIGPNGSGKSSTARTLVDLIWGHADGTVGAYGLVQLGGQQWELGIDGRRVTSKVNGEDIPLNGIPIWEARKRYTLAIDELLAADDGDLARHVVTASTGYDLMAAERVLGYSAGGISTRTGLYREYADAWAAYRGFAGEQVELDREQQGVRQLEADKAAAEGAAALLSWSYQLLEFTHARDRLRVAELALAAMPPILGSLTGGEFQELRDLRGQLEKVLEEIGGEEDVIIRMEGQRQVLRLPTGGPVAGLTAELEEKIAALSEGERRQQDGELEVMEARSRENDALKMLGASPDFNGWEGVTPMDIDLLEEHLQKFHQLLSRKTAIQAVREELSRSRPAEEVPSPEGILLGMQALVKWSQEIRNPDGRAIPAWSIGLLAVAGVVSTLCVVFLGRTGLLGLGLVIGAAVIALLARKKSEPDTVAREDYGRLSLPAPSAWTEGGVQSRLNDLAGQLGEALWDRRVIARVEVYTGELAEMSQELAIVQKQYERLVATLQLLPKLPVGEPRSYDGLFWFLSYATRWFNCYSERKAAETSLAGLKEQRVQLLEEINGLFARAPIGPVADSAAARPLRQQLVEHERSWRETGIAIENARNNIGKFRDQETQIGGKISALYQKLQVADGDEDRVRELASQVPSFIEGKKEMDRLATLLSAAEGVLRKNHLFDQLSQELDAWGPAAIEARVSELSTQVTGLESIRERIASINARVALAEGGRSMETALKRVEDAVAGLEAAYDDRLTSVTGKLLTDVLRKLVDERDRPAVFKSADMLFSRITHGRYRLRLKTAGDPNFAAWDTLESQSRELDELSSGTRIQLLLAVRLAFIDSQEDSVSLPIVADELLANSDSRRAGAIMDALVEISREGRQVFYFTSQEEEILRWRDFLVGKPEVSSKIFVLTGTENEAYGLNLDRPAREFAGGHLLNAVSAPGDLPHGEYGKLLSIGHFDLMEDSPDRLHVWYLFEEPAAIYISLQRGLIYWGQVQAYIKAGGDVGLDPALVNRAEQLAIIFGRYQELYRQGRPWRIDRVVLEDSGAVSGNFIDAVSDKLAELGYDPVLLLAALNNGEISRFSSRKIEQLQEYLVGEEYLSEEPILLAGDIWVQLAAFVSRTGVRLEEAQRLVERVIK